MANNFAIVRQNKRYSPDQVNGIWAENIRSILGKNVDDHRSHLNITITPLVFENYDHFFLTRKEQIRIANRKRETNEKKARMPGIEKDKKTGKEKYPALMQEFVFTHSNGAMTIDASIRYCKLAHQFICNWFNDCNVILSVIHLDETTPHIHIWTDYYYKFDNRFFQSTLQAQGKTDINAIRNAWQKQIEQEGFDLLKQDGSVVGDKHDGSKADKNKGDIKKQIIELREYVKTLEESNLVQKNEFTSLERALDIAENESKNLKKINSTLAFSSIDKDAQISVLKDKNNKLLNTIKYLKQILQPWHKYIKDEYDMDISKEKPPAVKLKTQIESTLQNKKVDKTDTKIPSVLN